MIFPIIKQPYHVDNIVACILLGLVIFVQSSS